MAALFFTLVCIICVAALLWAEKNGNAPIRAAAKIGASIAFVFIGYLGAKPLFPEVLGPSAPSTSIFFGLVFCMLGDVLLLPKSRLSFLLGMAAFAIGHIWYIEAFSRMGAEPVAVIILAIAVVALSEIFVLRRLRSSLGKMEIPVGIYTLIIAVMVATGISASFQGISPIAFAIGAVGFAISDIAVAKDRFIEDKFANKLWGLPLYYGAQLLFAHSV